MFEPPFNFDMLLATLVKPIQTKSFEFQFSDHYQQRGELRPKFQKNSLTRRPLGKNPSVNQTFLKNIFSRHSNRRRKIIDDGSTKEKNKRPTKKNIIYGEFLPHEKTKFLIDLLDSDSDSDFELPRRPSFIARGLSSLRSSCRRVTGSITGKITFTKAGFQNSYGCKECYSGLLWQFK